MIIHCPKCGYDRKHSDVTPATECPGCGIIFEKFLAAPPRKPVTRTKAEKEPTLVKAAKMPEPQVPTIASAVTACPACGGTVAYGAKTCPHCGKSKPAPKPPTKVTKIHLVFVALLLVAIIAGQSTDQRAMSAEEVTKLCAKEAGLDVNSSTAVTMQDIRTIDACVNRYGFKTKP